MKKKVAWQVSDCEGYGVIVFHHHAIAAKRLGANEFGADFSDVDIKRASEFDQFAEAGKIPKEAMIQAGWWFECEQCQSHVDSDTETPVFVGDAVFCCAECYEEHLAEIKQRNDKFEEFKTKVIAAKPYLNFEFRGGHPWCYDSGTATFDGGKYPLIADTDRNTGEVVFRITNSDKPAYDAFLAKVCA